jgi:hypothetical protein
MLLNYGLLKLIFPINEREQLLLAYMLCIYTNFLLKLSINLLAIPKFKVHQNIYKTDHGT